MQAPDVDKLSYDEVIKCVDEWDKEKNDLESFKISFLRNITIDLMVPYLKFLCYEENLSADIDMGSYDNVLQDVTGVTNGTDYAKSDLIVVYLYPRLVAKKLYTSFSGLTREEITEEVSNLMDYIENILKEIRKRSSSPVLLHNFELPIHPTFGILDYQDTHKQVNVVRMINSEMLQLARSEEGVYIIDMDLLQSRLGSVHLIDERFWHMARAPYSREGCLAIAKEYIKFIRAIRGKKKKCLVLDCDNTLWGGIVGEDGFEGIKIDQTYPGSAYREFQETILDLYNRGVLLAICSKNNESDIMEVLERHPDMILREEHFVDMKINWTDKVTNIKEIARDLNIGLDSLVFVDDNEFEINMVKEMLPEVKTLILPKEPSAYRRALEEKGFFDSIVFSEEDRKRSKMYKEEVKRGKAKGKFETENIEDYLKYLEMKIFIGEADPVHVARISQLTQRTNQFNLSVKRYSEPEINDLVKKESSKVFYASLSDRFGDSGLIGAAVLTFEGENAFIDTFLLSCRAIGRGIEEAMLKVCIDEAREKGCENIFGTYVPAKRNSLVEKFYEKYNFSKVETEENKTIYVLSLGKAHMSFSPHFKSIKVGDIEHVREENKNE